MFLFAEHLSQHYHSMPTLYTLYIAHYNKAAQQHNSHKFKPQASSATMNGIRHSNSDFQRQMKALITFESQITYTNVHLNLQKLSFKH